MHAAMTTTVSPASQSEKPYSPTWYETCRSLIHGVRSENCRPLRAKSKRAACSIQNPTSTRETSTARLPVAKRDKGRIQIASAPAIGSQMSTDVIDEVVIEPP